MYRYKEPIVLSKQIHNNGQNSIKLFCWRKLNTVIHLFPKGEAVVVTLVKFKWNANDHVKHEKGTDIIYNVHQGPTCFV